jgi:hypothetical protein
VLTAYQTALQNLLQNPGAPSQLYSVTSQNTWINTARGQLAGEAECIRLIGTISTVVGQRAYNFSSINTGVAATNGIAGVIHVRRISYNVGQNPQGLSGTQWITPRPWEWFDLYNLNNPVPTQGPPQTWSQYGQGSAGTGTGSGATGSFYLDPPPDLTYTLNLDCVCYPLALVDDTTVEAIPYLWTDAVPFFAAYYAYLSAQTGARQADAERMFGHYQTFLQRARQVSNPSVNRYMYEQAGDPAQAAKMGIKSPAAAGAGG